MRNGLAFWAVCAVLAGLAACGEAKRPPSEPLSNAPSAPPVATPHAGPVTLPARSFGARSANAASFQRLDISETVTPAATPDATPTSVFVLKTGSGATYQTTVYSLAGDLDPSGLPPAEVWAKVFKLPAGTPVAIHKVASESGAGFCGATKAAFLALAEHARADGRTVMQVAAFAGPDAPGVKAKAANLCAVFDFDAPSP